MLVCTFCGTPRFGTTISPYLFFWQASQEAEDVREFRLDYQPLVSLRDGGLIGVEALRRALTDAGKAPELGDQALDGRSLHLSA